jgi:hypothetical protein
MQRSEMVGLGVAVLGHAALFALLTLSFCAPPKVEPPHTKPIDVSLVDDVGLVATAPQSTEAPAQSQAPDKGPPEDAAAAAKQEAEPDPTPPAPQPEAAPPPKPALVAKPQPKKPAPPTPDKAKTQPTPNAKQAGNASNAKGTGGNPNTKKTRATGEELGPNWLPGAADKHPNPKPVTTQAPTMSKQAQADIGSAIKRQVQPCADRQVKPGPGAERIIVTIRLRLNRDGSLAANPAITGHSGVDDENGRYQDRVDDNAIATFKGCSPLRGLPQELYDVEHGWSVFTMRYNLKG